MTHQSVTEEALDRLDFSWKDAKILDLGCGGKHFEAWFRNKGADYRGVEKIIPPDAQIPDRMMYFDFAREWPLPSDNYVPFIFFCHSFEHGENPILTLKEALRCLAPGGTIFISTPNPTKHQILDKDADHVFVLNEMQMERLLRYCGFIDITTQIVDGNDPDPSGWSVITTGRKPNGL